MMAGNRSHRAGPMIVLALVMGAFLARSPAARAQDPDSGPAIAAMTGWLETIDAGEYGRSWDEASSLFRGSVTRDRWLEAMRGSRRPLGERKSRKLAKAEFHRSLPGAPDGTYFVLTFDTSFLDKSHAVETVAAMKEGDGWRAAGYFIR
jgi:hypothetical protein